MAVQARSNPKSSAKEENTEPNQKPRSRVPLELVQICELSMFLSLTHESTEVPDNISYQLTYFKHYPF